MRAPLDSRWPSALALLLTVSCQPWSTEGTLKVIVEVDPAARAECVLLKVSGAGGEELNSAPIARPLDRASLTVAVYQRGLPDDVTVQATGYSAGCESSLEPPEGSEAVAAHFSAWPPGEVRVRLTPRGASDGAVDGGADGSADGGVSDGRDDDGGLGDGGWADGGWIDGGPSEDGGFVDDGREPDSGTLCERCALGSRCNALHECVPQFPFELSNFTEGMLDDVSAAADVNLTCPAIINTAAGDGGIAVESLCLAAPPFKVIAQDGGSHPSAVVLQFRSLTVADAGSLTIEGERPLILVVRGDAHFSGRIVTRAGANRECAEASGMSGTSPGGGGGGGFGDFHGASAGGGKDSGAAQAPSGSDSLIPLRGGCQGGVGGGGEPPGGGGLGGGALQVSAVGTITVNGVVAAPGGGGRGGPIGYHGGGGGGSGGAVFLEGERLVLTGSARLTANGGAGGEGSDFLNPGNAGGDGPTDSAWNADGGHGGSGCGGNGGQGAADEGSAQGSPGDKIMGNNTCGGGGGGGAVGRIRLRSIEACERTNGAIVSPPAAPAACE